MRARDATRRRTRPGRALRGACALLCLLLMCAAACGGPSGRKLRRVPPGVDGAFTTWWNDGQVREEGTYRKGQRHGHVRGYHANGERSFEGAYLDGAPEGPQRVWHSNGALALEADFVRGLPRGERREYDERGVLRKRTPFVDGQAHGTESTYAPDGRVVAEGHYARGAPVGTWRSWDVHGRLVGETIHLRDGDRVRAMLETAFDPDGPSRVQTLRVLRDGVWAGRVTTWRADGSQASLAEWRDGRHHGLERTYDEAGRVRSEGLRVEGLREGTWTFWDATGVVERRELYEADRALPEADPAARTGAAG